MNAKHIFLSIAVLGVCIFFLRGGDPPVAMQSDAQSREEIRRLQAQMTALRQQMNGERLRSFRGVQSVQLGEEIGDDEMHPHSAGLDEPGDAEPVRPLGTVAEIAANLERDFETRANGAAPADLESGTYQDLRHSLAAGSRIEAVTCKGSLCKAEIAHADVDSYRKQTEALATGPRHSHSAAFTTLLPRDERGPVRSVVYFAPSTEELAAAAQTVED